jgi:hypothetical protein
MTVNVGTKRLIGAFTVGSPTTFGQGPYIRYEVLMSFDDSSVSIPTWTYVTQWLRAFSTSRGRASELADVDAGTANLTLDNRDRRFDPTYTAGPYYPNLRPMNRVWIRMQFNGVTHDVFKGYVESYGQQYPESGLDAVTLVRAVDEFKVLALRNLPTTDPPRDTYADVVQFDVPSAYWRMSDDGASFAESATAGPSLAVDLSVANGMTSQLPGAIVGDSPNPFSSISLATTQYLLSDSVETGQPPEVGLLTAMTVEMWFQTSAVSPALFTTMVRGVTGQWTLGLDTTGNIRFTATNQAPTDFSVSSPFAAGRWFHVCGVVDGTTLRLYLNGVQVNTAAFSGTVVSTTGSLRLGNPNSTAVWQFDEVAVYRYALPAARIAAHYQAGISRGFARSQLAGERMGYILDSIGSQAPRNLRAGARPLAGQYAGNGPSALETLRDVENAEAVDAVIFVANDGTLTFLDGGHRSVSPWSVTQATFGDAGGAELDFMDIQLDYSDAFIANTWNVTRDGGTTQTASDTTSISRYYERPQSLTGLKLRDDADALDVAGDMLLKYREPLVRVLEIVPKTMDPVVVDAVFGLELGDRIRVLLTPLGGGARFDQTLFIQNIAVDATPEAVFPKVTLGVSPV